MSNQESIGLKLKKHFLGEEIIEDFSALNCWIYFDFSNYKLAVEIDEFGHADRDLVKENKRQKELEEHLQCTFIRINPDKKDFSAYDGLGEVCKVFDEFKKREIKNLEQENEKLRKDNEEVKKENKELQKDKEPPINNLSKR